MYKVFENKHPQYLFHLIPVRYSSHTSRNVHRIPISRVKQFFQKPFSSTICGWNKLDKAICNSESLFLFRKNILHFIRPASNVIYNSHNPKVDKLITRLRLGMSHLREQKFKQHFQDLIDPICNCALDIESTAHFLLHCPLFVNELKIRLSNQIKT